MYIEIHNRDEMSQKVLYFKINNAFNMDTNKEENIKFSGIYAIYKDNICLYVGQSKNLASRIATHLKGKYENSTNIFLWNIENIGFGDFIQRNKISQESILSNCEKYFIKKLKPIENIIVDYDFEFTEEITPDVCFESYSDFDICIEDESILKIKSYKIDQPLQSKMYFFYLYIKNGYDLEESFKLFNKYQGISFCEIGVKNEH